jgi:hypothetical protein
VLAGGRVEADAGARELEGGPWCMHRKESPKKQFHIRMWVYVLSRDVHPRFEICALTSKHYRKPLSFHSFIIYQSTYFAQNDIYISLLSHNAPTDSRLHQTHYYENITVLCKN